MIVNAYETCMRHVWCYHETCMRYMWVIARLLYEYVRLVRERWSFRHVYDKLSTRLNLPLVEPYTILCWMVEPYTRIGQYKYRLTLLKSHKYLYNVSLLLTYIIIISIVCMYRGGWMLEWLECFMCIEITMNHYKHTWPKSSILASHTHMYNRAWVYRFWLIWL